MIAPQENASLRKYNSFGLDVKAEYFAAFSSLDDLRELLEWQKRKKLDLLLLGGGSNVLFKGDKLGLVLRNELMGINLVGEDERSYVLESGAGVVWHDLVMHCVKENMAGLENLSLIPGSVGASPMQNIGAYGVEIEQVFEYLDALHLESGEVHRFSHADCQFGYRESVFKRALKGEYCIVKVAFRLQKEANLKTSYGAIQEELERLGGELSIAKVSQAVINIRQSKLPDPKLIGNAGSFFKNPVVSKEKFALIKEKHPNLVAYPSGEGMKLAAGWLIDQAGWKGHDRGAYGVHDKQALVLVNRGGATGEKLFALSTDIIADIEQKFGVRLEREVNMIDSIPKKKD
ncbi:MAG: UDP-N-acetylmuramate dehydrogenase [Flavobacteriales bacterium]|nr:UDP-N-acetylmuramate dehydrogenase [Flavobacteriales bacterium]